MTVPVPVRLLGGLYVLAGALTIGAAALLAVASVFGMIFGFDGGGGHFVRFGGSDLEWGVLFLAIALFVALLGSFQAPAAPGCAGAARGPA